MNEKKKLQRELKKAIMISQIQASGLACTPSPLLSQWVMLPFRLCLSACRSKRRGEGRKRGERRSEQKRQTRGDLDLSLLGSDPPRRWVMALDFLVVGYDSSLFRQRATAPASQPHSSSAQLLEDRALQQRVSPPSPVSAPM